MTIDGKHVQSVRYVQLLIAKKDQPTTDIKTDKTDTESDITDQRLEEEENDTDKVIFIDDDMDNKEEKFILIHLYLNVMYENFR